MMKNWDKISKPFFRANLMIKLTMSQIKIILSLLKILYLREWRFIFKTIYNIKYIEQQFFWLSKDKYLKLYNFYKLKKY